MEALNIRLDQMESIKIVSGANQGMKGNVQGDTGFSTMLDKALNATDGVQKSTETKPEPKPVEGSSGDDSKLKQLVSEKDSAAEKTDKTADNKDAAVKDTTAVVDRDDAGKVSEENLNSQDILCAEPDFDEAELFAALEETVFKDNTHTEEADGFIIPFVTSETVGAVSESDDELELNALNDTGKKQTKKATKEEDAVIAVFTTKNSDQTADVSLVAADAAADAGTKVKNHKNADKPVFTVIDERTSAVQEHETGNGFVTSVQYDGNNAEMSLSLADKNNNGLTAAADISAKRGAGETTFGSMLSSEIQNNAGEFVKTGMITLRNNNSGTINLVLHPEELGNVKIKLELSDKLITGKIVVATEEAYGAFKNNIENLRQAFISSGFDNAGLELSWSGSGEGSDNQNDKENGKNPQGFSYSETMPMAAGAEDASAALYGINSVNVIV